MVFKESLITRLSKVEKKLVVDDKGVLIVDLNEDGTFGRQNLTEQELEDFTTKHRYTNIIIDDIPETDE